MSKTAYLVLCLLAGFIIESLFQLNVYIVILLMTGLFAYFWHIQDQRAALVVQRENQELQVKVQSSSIDAHLKLKQLITMVSSIPSPLLLLDQFGKVVLHNSLEFIQDQTKQDELEEVTYLFNDYVKEVQEFIKDSYILEKSFERVITIHSIEFQALSVPVISHGKFSGCLILFQDISKALQGEKMQKQFLADASHELKTPIAVIKGMIEILNRDDFEDHDTQVDFLNQIQSEINRLDMIVKDILVISKMSASHPILDRSKVDMKELIDNCCQSLEKTAQEKELQIETSYDCDDMVFCDPMRMRQVIVNLLSNAIKYSEKGVVNISLRKDDAHIILEVRDHGCGLSNIQQEKIFDRFYRVNDDRARKSGGSGLGLAIVKSIVDAHNARIEVDSVENQGTTFRVFLKN